jgi:hypothetical protein
VLGDGGCKVLLGDRQHVGLPQSPHLELRRFKDARVDVDG